LFKIFHTRRINAEGAARAVKNENLARAAPALISVKKFLAAAVYARIFTASEQTNTSAMPRKNR